MDDNSATPAPDQAKEDNSALLPQSDQEIEKQRLAKFPLIPDTPDESDDIGNGVLLSDQIKRLAQKYKMIYPFDEEKSLKAASYELRVGKKYGRAGETSHLREGQTLTIQPFDVVLIETLETLNLPPFLIARWNIRIRWAYRGLLWVGAPQVDPGYRGLLSCPLYNLSSKPVELKFGEQFAAMDFVRTTEVTPESLRYKWHERTRIVFEDYEKDELESGLVTKVARRLDNVESKSNEHTTAIASIDDQLKKTQKDVSEQLQTADQNMGKASSNLSKQMEESSKAVQSRLDSYTATTFTVIAFLFAALGIALTKSPEFSFWSSSAPLAAIALWFALRAFYFAQAKMGVSVSQNKIWFEIGAGAVLAAMFLVIQYRGMSHNYAEWTSSSQTSAEAKQAVEQLKIQIAASKELEKRVDALQAQIDAFRPQPPPKPTPRPTPTP